MTPMLNQPTHNSTHQLGEALGRIAKFKSDEQTLALSQADASNAQIHESERAYLRKVVQGKVRIQYYKTPRWHHTPPKPSAMGGLVDISKNGLQILCYNELLIGSQFDLTVSIAGQSPIHVRAMLLWQERGQANAAHRYGFKLLHQCNYVNWSQLASSDIAS